MKYLLLIISLVACSHSSAKVSPIPEDVMSTRDSYEMRLQDFEQGGFIFSKDANGAQQHQGEGILWGGVAHYVTRSCVDVGKMDDALITMVTNNKGGLTRYEPLPAEYKGGREITWDGAVGFYLSVADSITRCDGAAKWKQPFQLHSLYTEAHHGELYVGTGSVAAPGFATVRALIASRLGLRDPPPADSLAALDVATGALYVDLKAKPTASCYFANLGYLTILTARLLGHELSAPAQTAICQASTDFDIPTIDAYCGRKPLSSYVESFKENEWEVPPSALRQP